MKKTTALDLHLNPAALGLKLHGLDRARDPDFRAVQVMPISASSFTGPPAACSCATPGIMRRRIGWGGTRFLPPLFLNLTHEQILSVGVPPDWVQRVRHASKNSLFDLTGHLPAEAIEALLDYVATGVLFPASVATATARIPLTTPTRSAASAPSPPLPNWNGRSTFPGRSEPSSSTPPSGRWWRRPGPDWCASPARPEPARQRRLASRGYPGAPVR